MKRTLVAVLMLNLMIAVTSFADKNIGAAPDNLKLPVVIGIITKLDKVNVVLRGFDGKEYTFKGDNKTWKDYKAGDTVTISYEKDNLRAITKTVKP